MAGPRARLTQTKSLLAGRLPRSGHDERSARCTRHGRDVRLGLQHRPVPGLEWFGGGIVGRKYEFPTSDHHNALAASPGAGEFDLNLGIQVVTGYRNLGRGKLTDLSPRARRKWLKSFKASLVYDRAFDKTTLPSA